MGESTPNNIQHLWKTVTPFVSRSLPLGEPIPPNDVHAISVSMPTWESITASAAGEEWALREMQTTYPRFSFHRYVEDLNAAVKARLNYQAEMACMIFPSEDAARRLVSMLKSEDSTLPLHSVQFFLPPGFNAPETAKWVRFFAVLYHESLEDKGAKFWEHFGDGISSRHALFCLAYFSLLSSVSAESESRFQTAAAGLEITAMPLLDWNDSAMTEKKSSKSLLAQCATSTVPNYSLASADDVFLYPNGMRAISAVARGLAQRSDGSGVVVYGWPYSGTVPCIKGCGYSSFTFYGHGTKEELDHLESSLASGTRVMALFCEISSNPQLHTPDLHRIRDLANQYGFILVCDDTVATTVNLDILPFVDIIVSSLSKIFSGACNVMGGSLLINPSSRHYDFIHAALSDEFEDLLFPHDAMILAQNSSNFINRVHICNDNALKIANLIASHPSVEHVKYPTMVPSSPLYERYRRKSGGYGHLLSIIFYEPASAVRFYNSLDVCKGPSIGTNFSIAIPYSQIVYANELDWAAAYGIPAHIVRLSVGLEAESDLKARITSALCDIEKN